MIIPVIAIAAVSLAFYWMGRRDKNTTARRRSYRQGLINREIACRTTVNTTPGAVAETRQAPEPVSVLNRPPSALDAMLSRHWAMRDAPGDEMMLTDTPLDLSTSRLGHIFQGALP